MEAEEHILGDQRVERLLYRDPASDAIAESWHKMNFFSTAGSSLHNCDFLDPENKHYLTQESCQALRKTLMEMAPEQAIETIIQEIVQTGGPSGGCIPADKIDTPVPDLFAVTTAG